MLHSLLMHSLSSNHLYRCPTSYNIAGCVFSYRRKHFFFSNSWKFSPAKICQNQPKHRHTAPTSIRFSTGYGHPKLLIECWLHVHAGRVGSAVLRNTARDTATVAYYTGTTPGSSACFVCDESSGYEPSASINERVCRSNGTWSGSAIMCGMLWKLAHITSVRSTCKFNEATFRIVKSACLKLIFVTQKYCYSLLISNGCSVFLTFCTVHALCCQ